MKATTIFNLIYFDINNEYVNETSENIVGFNEYICYHRSPNIRVEYCTHVCHDRRRVINEPLEFIE